MPQTLLVVKLENGKITVEITEIKEEPSYIAKLQYHEQNTPNGQWKSAELRVRVEDNVERIKEEAVKLLRRIAEEQLDWVEIVNTFMNFAMSVSEPYSTPGADVEIHDTGGDYPEISIEITYIG